MENVKIISLNSFNLNETIIKLKLFINFTQKEIIFG